MVQKTVLDGWEAKLVNCEITSQAIWPIVKLIIKRGGTKAPSAHLFSHCPGLSHLGRKEKS
jgi:hypothetical protein